MKEYELMTLKEAAVYAKVSTATLRNYIRAGKLQAKKSVGKWWILKSELLDAFPHLGKGENND